uniref:Carbonyl reductase [NADPH] 1-like n=1 Tax=Stegastes partitus TaxID=144197 RepID=A0A3B5B951_9TELE
MSIKVAVVTGSNKGIGLAIVRALCKQFKGDVYLMSRDVGRGEEAVKSLSSEGLNPKFHQLDINDVNSIIAAAAFFKEKYGGVDVLVNNAAILFKDRRIQAAEMSFLCRVAGLSLKDRVRSSDIQRELGVEPLLLCVERSQLRWYGRLIWMPPERLPLEVFQTHPPGRRPWGRPRTRRRDYISRLAWERLGISQAELESVVGRREVWNDLLCLLPLSPDPG